MARKIDERIAALEKRLAQQKAVMSDLRAQQSKQERKDDARRKLLYGAAWLAAMEELPDDKRKQSMARVQKKIIRPRDREFLELGPLAEAEPKTPPVPDRGS